MGYNFPDSPTDGQIFSPGPSWTWSHGAWVKIVETDPALSGAQFFNSYLQAQSSPIAGDLESIYLTGYYNPGDGGAALYKRVTSEPVHAGKILSADGAWWEIAEVEVNPFMFGATGLGVADDSVAFQNCFDTRLPVFIPKPAVTFKVANLLLKQGQTLRGHGQFGFPLDAVGGPYTLTGNGVDPVLKIGNGLWPALPPPPVPPSFWTPYPRQITVMDLSMVNNGAICVRADVGINFQMERCRVSALGATVNALHMTQSYRCSIRNNFIGASGGGVAIYAMDNCNGMVIEGNTVTGGSVGYAIQVGQSQAIRIIANIIEVSKGGIWVSSTSPELPDGNCNGVTISNNYFEQVTSPLKLGTISTVLGLQCTSNYISNSQISSNAAREASIQFGRILGGFIADNVIYPRAGVEDIFWIWLESPSGGFSNLTVTRNYVNTINGAPANTYQFKGTYDTNVSVKQQVSGLCNFQFMGGTNPIGTDHVQEWISPYIDAAVSIGPLAWLTDSQINMGGIIKSVDIIDYNGGVLTNVVLTMGRTAVQTENLNLTDMATLTFTQGVAPVTLASGIILDESDRVYRIVTAGGATAKFRIRIRYRAN